MVLVNRKPLYDPHAPENRYPKMLYRRPGQVTGGTPVASEDEELAVLTKWDEEDKTAEAAKAKKAKA